MLQIKAQLHLNGNLMEFWPMETNVVSCSTLTLNCSTIWLWTQQLDRPLALLTQLVDWPIVVVQNVKWLQPLAKLTTIHRLLNFFLLIFDNLCFTLLGKISKHCLVYEYIIFHAHFISLVAFFQIAPRVLVTEKGHEDHF